MGRHWPRFRSRGAASRTCPESRRQDRRGCERQPGLALPFSLSSQTPSKLTATQLKGRSLDQETREEAAPAALPPQPLSILRPQFVAEERGLTPAQRGTALHLAMQYLPLDTGPPRSGQRRSWSAWCPAASSTPQQGAAADPGQLSAFFNSPLGREMASGPRVPPGIQIFRAAAGGGVCPGLEPGEEVLLQGVVDAWFETLEGITVVDFKSDRGLPVRGGGPGRGVPPSAGGVQPGPGGDHRKTGGPKGALVLRTGGAGPSVKGRQKGREKSQDNFLKK